MVKNSCVQLLPREKVLGIFIYIILYMALLWSKLKGIVRNKEKNCYLNYLWGTPLSTMVESLMSWECQ